MPRQRPISKYVSARSHHATEADAKASLWKLKLTHYPLMPGSLISSTRELGASGRLLRRNSCAEANSSTCNPTDSTRRCMARRTEGSSSTTKTTGATLLMYYLVGKVNWNMAPLESDSAHKRPPWDSTIDRLIDNPIPIPSGLVVKNGSKMCSARSGSSPAPES